MRTLKWMTLLLLCSALPAAFAEPEGINPDKKADIEKLLNLSGALAPELQRRILERFKAEGVDLSA